MREPEFRYLVYRPRILGGFTANLPGHRWHWVARLHSAFVRGSKIEKE